MPITRLPSCVPIVLSILAALLPSDARGHDSPQHVVDHLTARMAREGRSAELLYRRACEYRALGRLDPAADDLEQALRLDPSYRPALSARGQLERDPPVPNDVEDVGVLALGEELAARLERDQLPAAGDQLEMSGIEPGEDPRLRQELGNRSLAHGVPSGSPERPSPSVALIAAASSVDPARFQEETMVPARTAVKVLRYDLLWVS